jgi:O-antigen ligase
MMKPTLTSFGVPVFVGAALGASVLALSVKALVIIAGIAVLMAMATSSVITYFILVTTLPMYMDVFGELTVTKLIVPLVIGMILFNALVRRGPWPVVTQWPAGYLAALFFLVSAASFFFTEHERFLPVEAYKIPVYAAFFFFTLTFIRTTDDFHRLLWVLVITGLVEAIITAAQVHYGFVMPGAWRTNIGLPIEGAMDGSFMSFQEGKIRAEGTTPHPIALASFFLLAIPCTTFLCLREVRPLIQSLLVGVLALMVYAWWYTFARSSVIGFAAVIVVALWFRSKVTRTLILIGIGILITGLLSYQVVSQWFETGIQTIESQSFLAKADLNEAGGSFQFRVESIVGGWNLFLAHPWLGIGMGGSILHYTKHLPAWAVSPVHPATIHNVFLEIASESGIFALGGFMGLWVWAFICLTRGLRLPEVRPYAMLMMSILVGQLAFLMITPLMREIWVTLPMAIAIGHMAKKAP